MKEVIDKVTCSSKSNFLWEFRIVSKKRLVRMK